MDSFKLHRGHIRSPWKMVPKDLSCFSSLRWWASACPGGGQADSSPSLSPGGKPQERGGEGASLPSSLTKGVSGAGVAITHRANLSLQHWPNPTPSSKEQN